MTRLIERAKVRRHEGKNAETGRFVTFSPSHVLTLLVVSMLAIGTAAVGLTQLPSDLRVADVRCEYLTDPLGIDVVQPRLSWKLESQWRGQKQTAYQVLVASEEKLLAGGQGRPVGFGQGRVRPVDSRRLCGQAARVADAVLLEGAGLGQGRQAHAVQQRRPSGRWAC